jgi:hypothetical protein
MSPNTDRWLSGTPLTPDTRSANLLSGKVSFYEEGSLRLDVRDCVAVRHMRRRGQTIFYLSLFDDEIDSRFGEFISFKCPEFWTAEHLTDAARGLEPTDAAVITGSGDEVLVARGGSAAFPLYWTTGGNSIVVSTVLPVDRERRLSRGGLLASVSVVAAAFQNEPNLLLQAPLTRWFRCRRAAVSRLSPYAGCTLECAINIVENGLVECDHDELIHAIRCGFDKFGRRQRSRRRALVELSGGFDSSLAAIAARKHGLELLGASMCFPFYEFRFEEDLQQAVAKSLTISRVRFDGVASLAYTPPDWWPRLDEPATCVIGLERDLTIARLASREGIDRVLVGQGGDQLFSEDMFEPVPAPTPLARGAFSNAAWHQIEQARNVMHSIPFFLQRYSMTYLHDARLDVAMRENFGTVTRSPFTDLDLIRCSLAWAKLSARLGVRKRKQILAEAFVAELPVAVRERRGKVSWDGVCARAYAQHGDSIIDEFEGALAPLEHVGLNVRWLTKRVRQLGRWEKTQFGEDDREVFAAYALATWLRSWGVARVCDCLWTD